MLLYHYLYINILYIKEFNSIISDRVNNENIFINSNRFKIIKNVIIINFINKRTIKIALDKTIIISFIIPRLKTIIRRKEIKLFDLLRKLETNIILKRNKCFLKKAKETYKAKEMS